MKKVCTFVPENNLNIINMEKAFIYGKSVEGNNFTDRDQETKRLKLDFENGINVILISPRRMGKTSLVKKVMKEVEVNDKLRVVYMDIYDCRSEYEFYNRFASAIMKATSTRMEQILENIKRFLVRVSPKISFSPEPNSDFSLSLGITPKEYQPEEILSLPQIIAQEQGIHIVICIDEFQQIGEFPDSLTVQKRLRGAWQHLQDVSFCLFGSKKHLMMNLFQNKRMPFYQFGEMMMLNCIPTEKWVPFICSRFQSQGKQISEELAGKICQRVGNYSSYVQQLAWNVMAETDKVATEENFQSACTALVEQCSSLFVQQMQGLTSYQMNFIRALCSGIHKDFGSKQVKEQFDLGTKSNISRIQKALIEREIVEQSSDGYFLSDVVFEMWFRNEWL